MKGCNTRPHPRRKRRFFRYLKTELGSYPTPSPRQQFDSHNPCTCIYVSVCMKVSICIQKLRDICVSISMISGRSMNMTVNGHGITKEMAAHIWEGPAAGHMWCEGNQQANHSIAYSLYHASHNPNGRTLAIHIIHKSRILYIIYIWKGLHIVNREYCGWSFGKVWRMHDFFFFFSS